MNQFTKLSYDQVFTPKELKEYTYLMQVTNFMDWKENDPQLLEYEKRIEILDKLFDQRSKQWSTKHYFITKTAPYISNEQFIIWLMDTETGYALDAEDCFPKFWEAHQAMLRLEVQNDFTFRDFLSMFPEISKIGYLPHQLYAYEAYKHHPELTPHELIQVIRQYIEEQGGLFDPSEENAHAAAEMIRTGAHPSGRYSDGSPAYNN